MNKKVKSEDEITRNILNRIRVIQEGSETRGGKTLLNEEEERGTEKAIAITDDPRFGQNVLSNQIGKRLKR